MSSAKLSSPVKALASTIEPPLADIAPELRVPHTRCTRARRENVSDGQDQQHAKEIRRLYLLHKIAYRLNIRNIAPLCRVAHQQVISNQPHNSFGFGFRQAPKRTKFLRRLGTQLGVIARQPFTDVVKENRRVERLARCNTAKEFACEGMIVFQFSALDGGEKP